MNCWKWIGGKHARSNVVAHRNISVDRGVNFSRHKSRQAPRRARKAGFWVWACRVAPIIAIPSIAWAWGSPYSNTTGIGGGGFAPSLSGSVAAPEPSTLAILATAVALTIYIGMRQR
jgi:hypothetical protein